MDSSEDEGEFLPDCVTNYHFVNDKNHPICFSGLPLQRVTDEAFDGLKIRVYLQGVCDGGLGRIYKQVVGWRYELSSVQPEIFVLCKGGQWVKLQKPKKRFEGTISGILATIYCLHFVKKNPEALKVSVWSHLSRVFSSFEVEPSEDDILHHIALIRGAAKNDKDVTKAKYLLDILPDLPKKREELQEDCEPVKSTITVEENADTPSEYEEEDELFDTCCTLCDNGGNILCCEGRCMRSFHPTVVSGEGICRSLGFSQAQVEALPTFLCKNCQYEQHQCFVCGKLGSSTSSGESSCAEVFRCDAATCGRFYHPRCVATAIHREHDFDIGDLEKKIAGGQSFTCPAHKCFLCRQVEERKIKDLQFAVCRRCPKVYHRKCLPREIVFASDAENNIWQRAWDGLLQNRILIYCMDHEIIPAVGTPSRDHILFPDMTENKRKYAPDLAVEAIMKKRKTVCALSNEESSAISIRSLIENAKHVTKAGFMFHDDEKNNGRQGFGPPLNFMKSKRTSTLLEGSAYTTKMKAYNSSTISESKLVALERKLISEKTASPAIVVRRKTSASRSVTSSQVERRITALMQEVNSSFNKDEIICKLKVPSTYSNSRNTLDKNVTKGKVDAAVEAVRRALQKLEDGCSIDDAMAVCGPDVLDQIQRWKHRFGVYLAPFLHGLRYSSYGRHFTKLEKLQEIVNRLHSYVQDGDTIVDFCCGANDFSCLMKEKLENMGKRCFFKNYDLFRPKNDFNFQERDWFTVGLEELPAGSQLIMGLNPPFGVRAAWANKFINKALSFKPKLIILIVPRETERLDVKRVAYDLIWEDQNLLSGKSFYLPGSVDVHEKKLDQWNLSSPPLYLWSRADWTHRHKEIARNHGHLPMEAGLLPGQQLQQIAGNCQMEEDHDRYGDFSSLMNGYVDAPTPSLLQHTCPENFGAYPVVSCPEFCN
ncbi:hypothetical protein Dimus_019673 [Dionaea muscipula]